MHRTNFFSLPFDSWRPQFKSSRAAEPLPPKRQISDFPENHVPLTYFGLPPSMVQFYAQKGITHLYEWQGQCLLKNGVLEGRNITYSAPTSGGKTLVAEILMARRLFHNPTKNRAIMVFPYVSLVVEKYNQLHAMFKGIHVNGEKIKIGCYYGTKVRVEM